jgi:hypothetical protein
MASANTEAADLVKAHLKEKKENLEKQLAQKLKLFESKQGVWPSYVTDDMESDKKQIEGRISEIDNLLNSEDAKNRQRFQQMRKRKATQLIEQQQLKRRKNGQQGAPRKLDDEDKDFFAKCVEDKSTYHGRRQNLVMYTNRRVKSRDLLNIANHILHAESRKTINKICFHCIQSMQTQKCAVSSSISTHWQRINVLQKASQGRRPGQRKHSLPKGTCEKHKDVHVFREGRRCKRLFPLA